MRPFSSITAIAVLVTPTLASAMDVNGYLVLTSDYVYRGVTYTDGDPAVQAGVDLSFESGFYVGGWGSTIDISNGPGRQRDWQFNYYLGYGYDVSDRWSLGANVVMYTFPGQTGSIDYSYEELSLAANYNDRVWLEYSWSPDLYGTGFDTHNVEALMEYPLPGEWILGAGGGYYDVSELAGDGYAYWQLGLGRTFGQVDIDLRFHDTSRWVPIISTPERAGSRFAVSLRVQF